MSQSSVLRQLPIAIALVLSTNARAEFDVSASVSSSLSNAEDALVLSTAPQVVLEYTGNGLAFDSSWNTSFSNQNESLWTGVWSTDNQVRWALPSRQLSGAFSYQHQESDADGDDRSTIDTVNGSAVFVIPQTVTLSHALTTNASYITNVDGETQNQVEDTTATVGYSLNWLSSAMQSWQFGTSYTVFESGAQIVANQIGWQLQGSKVQLGLGGSSNITLVDDIRTSVLAGDATLQFQMPLNAEMTVSLGRSQTDALSFFDFTFIESSVVQQNQVVVDEFDVALSSLEVFSLAELSTRILIGESRALFEIEEFDVNQSLAVSYSEWEAMIEVQPSEQSTFSLAYSTRSEESVSSNEASASYALALNADWTLNAQATKTLSEESDINWVISMNYAF